MRIPMMEPRLFRETYEWTIAVFDGCAPVDKRELERIGGRLAEFYGEDPGEFEKALVTVAMDRFGDDEALRCRFGTHRWSCPVVWRRSGDEGVGRRRVGAPLPSRFR